jgi:hypothetical protein
MATDFTMTIEINRLSETVNLMSFGNVLVGIFKV